jgi:hypothetical protein
LARTALLTQEVRQTQIAVLMIAVNLSDFGFTEDFVYS